MKAAKPFPSLRLDQERGFTLIEVLVTVIILAIGLLGLAGLQLSGLRYTHSAYQNSQATSLGNDIIDRMRVNSPQAANGAYDIAIGATPTSASCIGIGANCNPATLANADLSEWKQSLAAILPLGDGAIQRNVTASGLSVTITIQWDDSRGAEPAKTLTVVTDL